MAKFKLSADHAKPNGRGGFSVLFHLDGTPAPFAERVIEARTTPEALSAFDAYRKEAEATGKPMALSIRLIDGRSPSGFKEARKHRPQFEGVNLDKVEA